MAERNFSYHKGRRHSQSRDAWQVPTRAKLDEESVVMLSIHKHLDLLENKGLNIIGNSKLLS